MEISPTADRIYKELLHERAGIWYISDVYGSKIMIKVLSPAIKAVMEGCKLELIYGNDVGVVPNIFHTGVKIYDDPVHYLSLSGTHRFSDEHYSLAKIMQLEKVFVHFHNELNVCQAVAEFTFNANDTHQIRAFQGNPKLLYKGAFTTPISQSLDRFQYSSGMRPELEPVPEVIETLTIQPHIENWTYMENTFIHAGVSAQTSINNKDEGGILENEVLVALGSLFDPDIFKSPQIPYKGKNRELTDIFSFYEYGIFLVETKALGVLGNTERQMDRRVLGIQKQIKKGIDQIVGAVKKISEQVPILDGDNIQINFNRTLLSHGIVLVSELPPFGDWDKIILQILTAMIENKVIIHIFDLQEFMRFIGYSKGDKYLFDYYLIERNRIFVEHSSMFHHISFVPGEARAHIEDSTKDYNVIKSSL